MVETQPQNRRQEDLDFQVTLLHTRDGSIHIEPHRVRGGQLMTDMPEVQDDDGVFIVDTGADDALMLIGAQVRWIARGDGGTQLMQRAARGAAAWRREALRMARRVELADRLMVFTEELARAQSVEAVSGVVMREVSRVAGGYTALMFLPPVGQKEPKRLHPVENPLLRFGLHDFSLPAHLRFSGPFVLTRSDVVPDAGGPYANLDALFHEINAVALACVPLGEPGVFCVVERRLSRDFSATDWDVLRTLARQIELALARIQLFEQVRQLSLTDTLTGLGNRRKLEIVLEYSFAKARRGESLSVIMLDLVDFKQVNDLHGHLRGDEILRHVADAIRAEVRGSDVAARYGGDEFLIILPGGTRHGAALLVERLRGQLTGVIDFRAGIAAYEEGMASPERLIAEADREMIDQVVPTPASGGPAAPNA